MQQEAACEGVGGEGGVGWREPQSHIITARERTEAGSSFPTRNAVFI